ncbi:hypothetical protein BDR07DRAFT_269484 [Suillus spraguei]|nr:hypothetical protein BDR07DRAFT_269484 [Suillus spraguei]
MVVRAQVPAFSASQSTRIMLISRALVHSAAWICILLSILFSPSISPSLPQTHLQCLLHAYSHSLVLQASPSHSSCVHFRFSCNFHWTPVCHGLGIFSLAGPRDLRSCEAQ